MQIEMVEVGPRDGLQNEPGLVPTADKLALIDRLIDCGARRIEAASFVNPRKVPQMADADAVAAALPDRTDVTFIGLVLNRRGADRALAHARIGELGAVCVTTDPFAMANQGQTSDESVEVARDIIHAAKRAGRRGQATIAGSFGCPYSGEVREDRVVAIAERLAQAEPVEVALADTIGVAVPAAVSRLVRRVREAIAPVPVRIHLHNTRNTGVANVWAAVEAGARTVDASLGGLGGCPFANGTAGNVPTEDVVYMLERSGVTTGLDLDRLIEASRWFSGVMNKELPGLLGRAGPFPRAA
jgi:hydroxymethylglutaryl-CoA lyase